MKRAEASGLGVQDQNGGRDALRPAARIRICIIGAGPSGLAAAKNCAQAGLDFVVFEKNDKAGGNWVFNAATGHSSVFENTHVISSRRWSEYEDFPMPADYPEYPGHAQMQAYFEAYARHFDLHRHIRFNHAVTRVEPRGAGGWDVTVMDQNGAATCERFDAVMVANGHHWDAKYPEIEGRFAGTYLHSHDFKGVTDDWRGKSVLVIGAGNSGCDVAVETARVAKTVCLSMRSPQWFIPKFLFGVPADVYSARGNWMPRPVKQRVIRRILRWLQGGYEFYGLPVNSELPLSHHPTINSDLIDFVRHGRIKPRTGIQRFDGTVVEFTDGRREAFDIVVACTGFWITFPFFDRSVIEFKHSERVPLFLKMMSAEYPSLYFIGLFQPVGCIWPLADYQAMLACAELLGRYRRPADLHGAIAWEMAHPHYPFSGGTRHSTEVDYHGFRRDLKGALKKAGINIGAPPKGLPGAYKAWPHGQGVGH